MLATKQTKKGIRESSRQIEDSHTTDLLEKWGIVRYVDFTDEHPFINWTNAGDAIACILTRRLSQVEQCELMKAIAKDKPDEHFFRVVDGKIAIGMWWD